MGVKEVQEMTDDKAKKIRMRVPTSISVWVAFSRVLLI